MKSILQNHTNHRIQTIPNLSEAYTLVGDNLVYDFSKCLRWLNKSGKALFGSSFRIHKADIPIIRKLFCYFIYDKESCTQFGIDLNKGLMLIGPVGCGKTSLMTLLNHVLAKQLRHQVKSCREVSYEFSKHGFETIQKYGGIAPQPKLSICFDDLGTEKSLKFYGNNCNVMAEILLSRYDLFINHHVHTHITTNLSANQLEEMYGKRVRSRLRAMVNLIAFDANTPDKRT